VAGPTEQGQPIGTLCLAVADAAGTVSATTRAPGDRAQVRAWATTLALDLLRRRVEGVA
jgi:nicotinamide mononucleotide (NMN) deamidase PncC